MSLTMIVVLEPMENLQQDSGHLMQHLAMGAANAGYAVTKTLAVDSLTGKDPWLSKLATDYEVVEYVCCRLGLEKSLQKISTFDDEKSYAITESEITIGSGEGYTGFVCGFSFDTDGNLTGHGVWE